MASFHSLAQLHRIRNTHNKSQQFESKKHRKQHFQIFYFSLLKWQMAKPNLNV